MQVGEHHEAPKGGGAPGQVLVDTPPDVAHITRWAGTGSPGLAGIVSAFLWGAQLGAHGDHNLDG